MVTSLDPRSIAIATTVSGILLAAVLALVHRDAPEVPGVRSWILACASMSIGLGLRQRYAGAESIGILLAANVCINTGPVSLWHGVRSFAGRSAPRWPLVAMAVFSLAFTWWFAYVAPDQRIRVVVFSLLISAWCFASAWEFRRLTDRNMRLGKELTSVPILLFAVVLVARAGLALTYPQSTESAAGRTGTPTDALTFLSASVALLASIVGMIACVNGSRTTEIRRLAFEDLLTGALSRRGLYDAIGRWLMTHGGRGTVTVIDLDRFKDINDTLGHAAGDAVLRALVTACRAHLPLDALLARMGGDEFVLVLPAAADAGAVSAAIARQFEAELKTAVDFGSAASPPGVSMGTALVRGVDVSDFDSAASAADRALYDEKLSRTRTSRPLRTLRVE